MLRCGRCEYEDSPPYARQCARCGFDLPRPRTVPVGTRLLGGTFIVTRHLARGGFGITYEGTATGRAAPVAIKEFFPEGSRRDGLSVRPPAEWKPEDFIREKERFLHSWEQVSHAAHPGIVEVFRAFPENVTGYVVMEYLPGETLQDLVEEQGPLDEATALAYAGRIGDAVARLHQLGIVHLDLKPENVLVTNGGRAALIDFDAARELGAQRGVLARRVTPGFAPPEQYRAGAVFTPAADVYGLAATLYFLLTGRIPDEASAREHGATLQPVRRWNRSVSEVASEGITSGLGLTASERPASIAEFLHRLNVRIFRDHGISVHSAGTTRWYSASGAILVPPPRSSRVDPASDSDRTLLVGTVPQQRPETAVPRTVGEHRGPVHCVVFSPDGHVLASAGEDGTVRLWDISRWDSPRYVEQRRIEGHEGAVTSVAFDPGGVWIASGGHDQQVRVWSREPGVAERRLSGHTGWVTCLAFGAEGKALFSGSSDGTVGIWPLAGGLSAARRLRGPGGALCAIVSGPDGRLIVTAGEDTMLRLWDLRSGEAVGCLAGHSGPVWSVALHTGGMPAAPAWQIARALFLAQPAPVFDAVSLASAGRDGMVLLWDAAGRREVRRFEGNEGAINCVAISPDGRRIASAGEDQTLRLWEAAKGAQPHCFEGHEGPVRSVAFSPVGHPRSGSGLLASGGWDGTVRLWEVMK